MKIIEQVTTCANTQANLMTDGILTCFYQEIPDIFYGIQRYLKDRGFGQEDYLVLECENSLPSALVLLYLLEEGYSCLLLSRLVNVSQNGKKTIPQFCRYRIGTHSLTANGSQVDLRHPEQFLHLVENEVWIDPPHKANHASPKLYLRTSGSTGKPKMVVHSHAKLMENALNCVNRLGLEREDRIAIPVPIFHLYGFGAAFLPGVAVGASIDLQPKSNLLRYLQRERDFNPNVAFMTPTFCETLLKGRKSPRKYKLTVAAGDSFNKDTFALYESQMGCLVKLYGSTEMGAISAASPHELSEVRSQTVGKPMPGVQMRVEKRIGEFFEGMEGVGELWCHHESGFEGYVDDNGNPIVQNTQDDWFCTKDLGRICSDGYLEVLGRCDHSVNRDGLLVLFSDVERAIESIEGVESVVVVSKGESQRGKGIVAYCVLVKDSKMTEVDIRTACFERLQRRAIPDKIWIIKSLPTLPNGKVDRQKLISIDDQVNLSKSIQI